METCKKCQAMLAELEQMLLGDQSTMKEHAAREMLLRAGKAYQSLRIKQLEMEAINRTVNVKPKNKKGSVVVKSSEGKPNPMDVD